MALTFSLGRVGEGVDSGACLRDSFVPGLCSFEGRFFPAGFFLRVGLRFLTFLDFPLIRLLRLACPFFFLVAGRLFFFLDGVFRFEEDFFGTRFFFLALCFFEAL